MPEAKGYRLRFERDDLDLQDLSRLLLALDAIYELAVESVFDSERSVIVAEQDVITVHDGGRPLVTRITKSSPLVIDLASVSQTGAAAAALYGFSWVFRHPEDIGAWFQQLRVGWYGAKARALQAQLLVEEIERTAGGVSIENVVTDVDDRVVRARSPIRFRPASSREASGRHTETPSEIDLSN